MNATARNTPARKTAKKPKITVAEYLTQQIDLSGKSQALIAEECQFQKPNIISMLKKGTTNVPIAKVGLLSKSLGVDAAHFFKLVMEQYYPETWHTLETSVFNQKYITDNEMEVIELLREVNVVNPKIHTEEEKVALLKAFSKLKPDNGTR